MNRNNKLLRVTILLTAFLLLSCSNEKDACVPVYWLPKKTDFAGTYYLDRNYHEKNNLPKEPIIIILKQDSSFTVKNFPYSKSLSSDSINFIKYGEGSWSIEKTEGSNKENGYMSKLNLSYHNKNSENENAPFLNSQEMYMKPEDSSFSFCFYSGDPDHNKNRYYFYQEK